METWANRNYTFYGIQNIVQNSLFFQVKASDGYATNYPSVEATPG